jgi:phosphoesterase RecJ-like protein
MPSLRHNLSEFSAVWSTLFAQPQRVLITAHRDPDMDAIGSCVGLASVLTAEGHSCTIWLADPLPEMAGILPGSSAIVQAFPSEIPSVCIALDCSNFERIRDGFHLSKLIEAHPQIGWISLDHHTDHTYFAQHNWMLETASSTGEMLCMLFQALQLTPDALAADALYAAIVFDTGRFLFSNVTAATFTYAAWLATCGANLSELSVQMFESYTEADFVVMNTALTHRVVHPKGYYAYTVMPATVPQNGLRAIDVIRNMAGVNVFASFSETESGEVKINLRSKSHFNVQEVAALFGGGGHKKAAGITWAGPLSDIQPRVLKALDERLSAGQ